MTKAAVSWSGRGSGSRSISKAPPNNVHLLAWFECRSDPGRPSQAEPRQVRLGRVEGVQDEDRARTGQSDDRRRHRPPVRWCEVVERAVVDEQVEGALDTGQVRCGQVAADEVDPLGHAGGDRCASRLPESDRREVDADDVEAGLGQEDGVGTGPTTEVDRVSGSEPFRRDAAGLHERDQLGASPHLPRCAPAVHEVVEPDRRHQAPRPSVVREGVREQVGSERTLWPMLGHAPLPAPANSSAAA